MLVFQLICSALLPTLAFARRGTWVKVLLLFGLVGGYFKGTLSPVSALATGSGHRHLEREENRYIFACGFKGGKRPSAGCAEVAALMWGLRPLSRRHGAGGGGSYGSGARCHAHSLGAGKTHDSTVNATSSDFLEPRKAEGFHREELYAQHSDASSLARCLRAYRVLARGRTLCAGCGVLARTCTLQFHLREQSGQGWQRPGKQPLGKPRPQPFCVSAHAPASSSGPCASPWVQPTP